MSACYEPPHLADASEDAIADAHRWFYLTRPGGRDVAFHCGAKTWHVPQLLVELHAFNLEGFNTVDGQENSINFSSYTEACVDSLVTYLHTFDYKSNNRNVMLHLHLQMQLIGQEAQVEALVDLSSFNFKKGLEGEFLYPNDLVNSVKLARESRHNTTNSNLYDIMVDQIILRDVLASTEELQAAMKAVQEMAIDIVNTQCKLLGRLSKTAKLVCPSCKQAWAIRMRSAFARPFQLRCPGCNRAIDFLNDPQTGVPVGRLAAVVHG